MNMVTMSRMVLPETAVGVVTKCHITNHSTGPILAGWSHFVPSIASKSVPFNRGVIFHEWN